jgi:hypothetical protein
MTDRVDPSQSRSAMLGTSELPEGFSMGAKVVNKCVDGSEATVGIVTSSGA